MKLPASLPPWVSALACVALLSLTAAPATARRLPPVSVDRGFYLRLGSGPGYAHFFWAHPSFARDGGGIILGNSLSIGGAVSNHIVLGGTVAFDPVFDFHGHLHDGPIGTPIGAGIVPFGMVGPMLAIMITDDLPLELALGFAGGGAYAILGGYGAFTSASFAWHPFHVRWLDIGFYLRATYAVMTDPGSGGTIHMLSASGGASIMHF